MDFQGCLGSRRGTTDCVIIRDEEKRSRLSYGLYDLNVLGKIRVDGYSRSTKCRCVLNLDLLT